MDTYIPTFNKHAQCLTKKLENMASNNQNVSLYTHMTLCALDVVCGEYTIYIKSMLNTSDESHVL